MKTKIALLLIAGASIGPVKAQTNTPEKWTLRQCIEYAIEHHISIRESANTVEQSKVESNTSKWSRLPNVNGSVGQNWSWGRTASPMDNSYSDINSANSSFSVGTNVPIFTGLKLSNQYALSQLNLKASLEDLSKAKEDIAMNVASFYLQALLNFELARVALDQIELSREQLLRIRGLFNADKAAPADVAEAEARLAQDQMNGVQADNKYKLSLLDLSQLLELPTPEGFALAMPEEAFAFVALTPPDDIFTQALALKPSIKAAQYRLRGADHTIRISQSEFYPQLSFGAGLGTNYYTVDGKNQSNFSSQMRNNLNKYAGFSLSVPLFNRFSVRNRVRTARIQKLNQELKLDNTRKTLYKEIQQAWYSAVAAESKYTASETSVKASKESFRLISEKFNNDKATFMEYNEAKLGLTKALSDQIQAKYDYLFRTKILDFYKGRPLQ